MLVLSLLMEYILGGGSLETHYLSAQDVRNSARGHVKPAVTATKLQMQYLSIYGSVRVGFGSFDPARAVGWGVVPWSFLVNRRAQGRKRDLVAWGAVVSCVSFVKLKTSQIP